MRSTRQAHLDLAAAMIIVGSSVVVGKVITQQFPIFLALTIRFLIALPILIGLSSRSQILYIPSRKGLLHLFLQALTGVFLFNALLLTGLRYTTASQSGLLTSTVPAMIAVLGWLILREPLSRYEWAGVALSAVGAVIINMIGTTGSVSQDAKSLLGNSLVFGAVICEGLFTIFRKTTQQIPALLAATWVTGFGLLLCVPIGLYELAAYDVSSITAVQMGALLYYGAFVSVLGYFLWFRGLGSASTGAAGILAGLVPISTVAFSTVLLGEPFTVAHLLGLVLILGGIGALAWKDRPIPQIHSKAVPDSV